jgi:hypothetical protein
MTINVKVSASHCSLFVQGMDMNCPLCGTLVKSGERHECSKPEPAIPPKRRASGRRRKGTGYQP